MSKYSRRLLYKERAKPMQCEICFFAGGGTYISTKTGYAHLICLNIVRRAKIQEARLAAQLEELDVPPQDGNLTEPDES